MKLLQYLGGRWLLLLLATWLSGCASSSSPMAEVVSAVVAERFGTGGSSKLPAQPNPAYRYLRVEVAGRPAALLVLGYVDTHPQGEIEVWYSAKGEVIKTQNGRIVATAGLETDWRAVRFGGALPAWVDGAADGGVYQRSRDQMPGYHFGIADQLELRLWVGLPPIALVATLPAEQASRYRWFREVTLRSSGQLLPPAWYAWGVHRGQSTVVYSQQCLSLDFCLKLQRWPVQEEAS